MGELVTVNIVQKNGTLQAYSVAYNTTLLALSKEFEGLCAFPILLAKVNNVLQELHKTITEECTIEFLDITDNNGFRAYQRSVSFLMICTAKEILGPKTRIVIEHSMNKNYYCEILEDRITVNEALLAQIEKRMRAMVAENLPIKKLSLSLEKAISISETFGLKDKMEILKYRRTSNVNFYKLSWFYDYFYGQLAVSTGVLGLFKLVPQSTGFILQFPDFANPSQISQLQPFAKISKVFLESSQWARILNIDTVGALNEKISNDQLRDIIHINEALHEKKIASIADRIHAQGKRLVLIAGPSSSGKTTFSHRLSIQLRVNGLRTHIISIDDYFKNQTHTPSKDQESFDFESVDAIDAEQLNNDWTRLMQGETVPIPSFNFVTGKRENKGRYLQLRENDVLIVEGIHGLNEAISSKVKKEDKFKIFISALTQLNVDDHNRIPTTDTRLIRRIVRDHQFRKLNALATIKMWPSVTKGEVQNIFPFQEEADAIFNSALVYELSVLKPFVEPILFHIDKMQPQYTEARRLIKFLDCFLSISSEEVPQNSIIREFIGGSCF